MVCERKRSLKKAVKRSLFHGAFKALLHIMLLYLDRMYTNPPKRKKKKKKLNYEEEMRQM